MSLYRKQLNAERTFSSIIPYSSHVNENTLVTKEGDYIRIWKLAGISFETADYSFIQKRKDDLNTLWRSIGSEHISVWTHQIRRRVSDNLESVYDNIFCRDLDKKYYQSFEDYQMMENTWYLTLVYRPNPSHMAKVFVKSARRSLKEIKSDQEASLWALDEISLRIERSLLPYGIKRLGVFRHEQGFIFSEKLSFLNFLLTGEFKKIQISKINLNEYLGNAYVFVGRETLEIRLSNKNRYARLIDFKDYVKDTHPGILNILMYSDCEYVMTQSFSFLSKKKGEDFLKKQRNQLHSTEDGAISQIEQINDAIDGLISGEFLMGEYHYSLMVYGDTLEEVRKNSAEILARLENVGFLVSSISLALDAAFFAQLPGNWFYRHRIAKITSHNFSSLACFHNFDVGKREGNPWGQALTLLKSPSCQPIYFNFHASKASDDVFDQKLLGNASLIGQSSSGKTVLLTFMLAQSQKYAAGGQKLTGIFFDKDHGAEIAIRAMGGRYLSLENGKATGFNPFQMDPLEENILFLEALVQRLCSVEDKFLSAQDTLRISHAVRTVMKMPKAYRRLTTVTQNITEDMGKEARENSLIKKLTRWCVGGALSWVFDNPEDLLEFNSSQNFGIDGTSFLDNPLICTPIAMYLLHRLNSLADGRRFILIMDEFWKWLKDDYFANFASDQEKTIRKKNGIFIFASQSPSDVLRSNISSALVEQCATQIYLANPAANHEEYVKGFSLSEVEFSWIKKMDTDSRLFLVKQGQYSYIAGLDLHGFEDELAVLSSSVDNVALMNQIMRERGEKPSEWLPDFYQKIHERKNHEKN